MIIGLFSIHIQKASLADQKHGRIVQIGFVQLFAQCGSDSGCYAIFLVIPLFRVGYATNLRD